MSDREAHELADRALGLASNGLLTDGVRILTRLVRDGDAERVYGLCCRFAEAGRKALVTMAGHHAPIFENGEQWIDGRFSPEDPNDPLGDFSVRFLVAYGNGQTDTARAHYDALLAAGTDSGIRGVGRLFADIAALCWAATEQQEDRAG